jgi:hypothetical protein
VGDLKKLKAPGPCSAAAAGPGKVAAVTFEAMLAQGSGRVVFAPSVSDALLSGLSEEEADETRRLLLTPGVRGLWVPGHDGLQWGQEVQLCSSPVESEPGDDGEPGQTFVQVKTESADGGSMVAGWVMLKYIRPVHT